MTVRSVTVALRAPLMCTLLITCTAATAAAQTARVYVMPPADDSEIAEAIADARASFTGPLTGSGEFTVAGDIAMDQLVADCRESVAVSPAEERRCRLMVARRQMVDWVLVATGRELGRDAFEFSLEVIDPERSESPYVTQAEVRGQPLELAVRGGLDDLARDFVRWATSDGDAPTGFIETRLGGGVQMASLCVNGEVLGPVPGPGQYRVPAGPARVEVSAVGYLPFADDVTIPVGDVLAMPEVVLEPVPAVVHLTSNVHGATVRVDGRVAETTWGNGTVRLELAPGSHEIVVSREGWTEHRETLRLERGQFRPVSANLSPVD